MIEKYQPQETLPGLSERETLEGFSAQQLTDYIVHMGGQVTELETKMNLASEVLEGTYGVTVEDILNRGRSTRLSGAGEKQNGQQE